ncbi:FG-GAP repeat [Carpediemonas membranifera]|uniref:FG-GAP repeat n=1 Tax=Carpediemonas membranifera TaxID=201153 RepID=A0A8J6APG7_9EUKA|nr:FG-GAP repeat [Carpediemonas membranifera]|eukprot:KAG9389473.1 FG-GAP repeat [Carpediemonas membranifera]
MHGILISLAFLAATVACAQVIPKRASDAILVDDNTLSVDYYDSYSQRTGRVYLLERLTPTSFGAEVILDPPALPDELYVTVGSFGKALSIEGDVLCVGAPGTMTSALTSYRSAYLVYKYCEGDSWKLDFYIVPTAGAQYNGEPHTIVVNNGVIYYRWFNYDTGDLEVRLADTNGTILSAVTLPESAEFPAIDASGAWLVVGDYMANTYSGAAYVYNVTDPASPELFTNLTSTSDSQDTFGKTVSVSGDVIAIGAPNDRSLRRILFAYKFNSSSAEFGPPFVLARNSSIFSYGTSVATTNHTLFVGAKYLQNAGVVMDYSTCDAGYRVGNTTDECEQCPAGTSSTELDPVCNYCQAGQYQPNAGQSTCIACSGHNVWSGSGPQTECRKFISDNVIVTNRSSITFEKDLLPSPVKNATMGEWQCKIVSNSTMTIAVPVVLPASSLAGEYTMNFTLLDLSSSSTSVSVSANFSIPDTTVLVDGTAVVSVVTSPICPSEMMLPSFGVSELNWVTLSDEGDVECYARATLSTSKLIRYFAPNLNVTDSAACVSLTGAKFASLNGIEVSFGNHEQNIDLGDGRVCFAVPAWVVGASSSYHRAIVYRYGEVILDTIVFIDSGAFTMAASVLLALLALFVLL